MWEDDEGTTHGRFRIPARHGQMLRKMILALTSPARSDALPSGIDPDLPTPVRDGIAFTQLIESITAEQLPKTGGCGATVVVTMTLDQLLADLDEAGVCTLDTGGRISAPEARRLACRAGIIPMVLGGKTQVLDVGRKCRFHTEPMRIAMGVRDGGCTTEGCEVTTRALPRPPRHPLLRRRPHQRRRRPTPLPPPPPPHPRPPLPDHPPAQRQGQLPQTNVGRPQRALVGACVLICR